MFKWKANKFLSVIFEFLILFLAVVAVFYIFCNWKALNTIIQYKIKISDFTNPIYLDQEKQPNHSEDRIIIPKINVDAPLIRTENENDLAKQLKRGVIFYPKSYLPGEKGSVMLIGHSSGIPGEHGAYDTVFSLLSELKKGDLITLQFNQNKFDYRVFEKKIVQPNLVKQLNFESKSILNLITCWPIGTSFRRLVVRAYPDFEL